MAAESARTKSAGFRWLLDQFGKKPIEAIGLLLTALGALGGGLYLLGYWTQRAREALLHVDPLSYPRESLVFTGLDALFSLLWNGLSTPFSAQPQLSRSAFALLVVALFCWFVVPRLRRGRAWILPATLAVAAVVLTVGGALLTFGLRATHPQGESASPGLCSNQLGRDVASRITYETCSWLANDSPANEAKRQSLSGLLSWLLLASLAALTCAWRAGRQTGWREWLRRGLLGWQTLLLLFLLGKLPLAHAYTAWGLSYPAATLTGTCDEVLIPALAQATCCAFEVSDAAETPVLLLRGSGCPGGGGLRAWGKREEEACSLTLQRRRPVVQGCG